LHDVKNILKAGFRSVLLFFLVFSQAAWPQDFSSIDRDLQQLENLIINTLTSTEEQQKLLEDLKLNLTESGKLINSYENIIQGQEKLLKDLQIRLSEMSETYRKQSSLSEKYAKRSRFWRNFSLIAVPVTAAISGSIVWAASR